MSLNLSELNEQTSLMFKGEVIDVFEQYIDDHIDELSYDNTDAARCYAAAVEDGVYASVDEAADNMGLAHLYGDDFDYIGDEIDYCTNKYFEEFKDAHSPIKLTSKDVEEFCTIVYGAFYRLMCERNDNQFGPEVEEELKAKLADVLDNWELTTKEDSVDE